MAVREVVQMGHPALKASNKKITLFNEPELTKLIVDMKDTMLDAGLVGLAAPQIAENVTAFVTYPRKTASRPGRGDIFRVYINPSVIRSSKKTNVIYEGCGSVARGTLFGPVRRPAALTVEAYDENGKKFHLTADGLLARVIWHEYDHLSGTEFVEKLTDPRLLVDVAYYRERIRNSSENLTASKITKVEYTLV